MDVFLNKLIQFYSSNTTNHRHLTQRIQNGDRIVTIDSMTSLHPMYSGAEYSDDRVCLCLSVSVCLSVRDHIFGTTRPIFTKFFVHVTHGRALLFL